MGERDRCENIPSLVAARREETTRLQSRSLVTLFFLPSFFSRGFYDALTQMSSRFLRDGQFSKKEKEHHHRHRDRRFLRDQHFRENCGAADRRRTVVARVYPGDHLDVVRGANVGERRFLER